MFSRNIFSVLTVIVLSSSLNLYGSDLTVKGDATLFKPADEVSFSVGVTTRDQTAEDSLKSNNSRMNHVLEAFKKAGLESTEYSTGNFSIYPIYSQRPKDASSDWKAEIIAYEVTNSLNIKTSKIKQTGELLDVATKSGANNIGSIQFGISNPRQYRSEAIQEASKNAISDAKVLASAAGVRLGGPLSITLDDAQKPSPTPQLSYRTMDSVPVEPGTIEITASVTLTYSVN